MAAQIDLITQLGTSLWNALQNLALTASETILGVAILLVLLIIGWIVGIILKEITIRILKAMKIDQWIEDHKLLASIGHVQISVILGTLVKWVTIAVFLTQAVAFMPVVIISVILNAVVYYLPLVIGALLLLTVGFLIAAYCRVQIEKTAYKYKKPIALGVELGIIYITAVMAVQYLGFDATLLIEAFKIAFSVIVVVLAIVIGIWFAMMFRKDIKNFFTEVKKDLG